MKIDMHTADRIYLVSMDYFKWPINGRTYILTGQELTPKINIIYVDRVTVKREVH